MQATMNIQVLDGYGIKKIVTACPHCFNTLKNEYPALGGNYEVLHHSEYLQQLINDGKVKMAEGGSFKGKKITYHDSCSGLRELGVQNQPRTLIGKMGGVEILEMKDSRQCCGFGGTFALKYGEVSSAICTDKCEQVQATGAQAVVLGDLGCMLNIEGRLRRMGDNTQVLHVAELLTGRKPGQI